MAPATRADEGADGVLTVVLAAAVLHATLVHVPAVVGVLYVRQEPGVAGAGVVARGVGAHVDTPAITNPTLVHV